MRADQHSIAARLADGFDNELVEVSEDVLAILSKEKENGTLVGVIVQFGGQTPLKLSRALEAAGAPIIGTSPDSIDVAEDRERFQILVKQLGLKQPANASARAEEQAVMLARAVGYPLVVRPWCSMRRTCALI